jgi:hypothetical protein
MRNNENKNIDLLLQKGLRSLAHHRPDLALDPLRAAIEAIPPARGDELSRALYWLSLALLKLDKKDLALKSLSSAQKLRRRGFARRFYLHNVNEYGMPRKPSPELDDFYAFMSIQLAAYLVKKPRRRFASPLERETVLKIIMDAWKILQPALLSIDYDCGQKLQLFKRARPSFPSFGLGRDNTTILRHGFDARQAFGPPVAQFDQRCVCGSGLPYSRCCGRVKGLGEL